MSVYIVGDVINLTSCWQIFWTRGSGIQNCIFQFIMFSGSLWKEDFIEVKVLNKTLLFSPNSRRKWNILQGFLLIFSTLKPLFSVFIFFGKHPYLKPMFQESRKVKIYFTVKAEDKKKFVFCDFSVVEYFGHYVQFCLFFTPVFHKNGCKNSKN